MFFLLLLGCLPLLYILSISHLMNGLQVCFFIFNPISQILPFLFLGVLWLDQFPQVFPPFKLCYFYFYVYGCLPAFMWYLWRPEKVTESGVVDCM